MALESENLALEKAMELASLGMQDATTTFFHELIKCSLVVPHRFQHQALSNAPEYPNPFINILGIQDKERVVVPVFTQIGHIIDWCGAEFTYEVVTSASLFERIPAEWWIVINPGQEIEKELSPWEIDLLRGGEASIPALVEENITPTDAASLTIHPLEEGAETALKSLIETWSAKNNKVVRVYLGKEESNEEADDEEAVFQLLVGVETDKISADERAALRQDLIDTIAPAMIGRDPARVFLSSEDSGLMGMLHHLEPVYTRQNRSWVSKIFKNK